jgi:hypothetical protein
MAGVTRRVVKRFGLALIALVAVPIAVDAIALRYLRSHAQEYRREIAEIRQHEIDYRRPLVIGEPLEQNAAGFYREAFLHWSGWQGTDPALRAMVNAGVKDYPADDSEVRRRCADANSASVRTALRSTRCDWDLPFGVDNPPSTFDHGVDAFALASCVTLQGHRLARDGDRRAASQAYLETLAIGCDLGMGNDAMCLVGAVEALAGLSALGRLVATVDADELLDDIEQRLSTFEARLPDTRIATRQWVVWQENAISLDQLAFDGGRFTRGVPAVMIMHAWTALRLLRDDSVLRDVKRVSAITTREEGLKLVDDLKRDGQRSHGDALDWATSEVPTAVLGTFNVIDKFRATQVAIQLQRWHIAHGSYPANASSMGAPAGLWGLQYEADADGRGYKLIGYQRTLLVETPAR